MAKANNKADDAGAGPLAPAKAVKRSFARGAKSLEKQMRNAEAVYTVPWFAMVGEPGSGKGAILGESGLAARPGSPETFGLDEPEVANYWWFFNEALVIDFNEQLFAVTDEPKAGNGKAGEAKRGFFARLFKRKAAAKGASAWRDQLDGLRDARRLRPIDGLVLTIDVGSLLMKTPESAGKISRRAEAVAARIHEAQYQLAVDFPIHVVLTGCEKLKGFSTFTRALPEQIRDQIFGWSSPYEPDTGYESEWVEEAIASLHEQTCVAQLELLNQVTSQRERDELYLLPREIRQLAEPLRLYLDPLFKTTSFRRSLPLRGIFLTARVPDKAPPPEAALPPGMPPLPPGVAPLPGAKKDEAPRGKPRFVRQLFSEKIFAEPGLARIDEKRNKELNRKVRNARIALFVTLLVVGVLILLQRTFTGGEIDEFNPMLNVLKEHVASQGRGTVTNADQVKVRGVKALETLAALDFDEIESPLAPTTLFEGLTAQINRAIAEVGASVGEPLRTTLKTKADIMLPVAIDKEDFEIDRAALAVTNPRPQTYFTDIKTFVDEVTNLQVAFEQFNQADLVNIARVYLYLTGNDITDKLASQAGLYRDALDRMKDRWPSLAYPEPYGRRATLKLQAMVRRMQEDVLSFDDPRELARRDGDRPPRGHPLVRQLGALERDLDQLNTLDAVGATQQLRQIRKHIQDIEESIADRKADWLFAESFTPGEEYIEVLNKLAGPAFQQPEDGSLLGEQIRERNEELFQKLTDQVQSAGSGYGGFKFLARDEEGRVVLSRGLRQFKDALQSYFEQPYVILDKTQFELDLSREAGNRAQWNDKLINRMLSWERNFRAYVGTERPGIGTELNKDLDKAARTEFRDRVRQVMLDYASPRGLTEVEDSGGSGGWTAQRRQDLKDRISNIADLFEPILGIVKALEDVTAQLNMPRSSDLFTRLRDDVLDLLKKVDAILKEEKPYAIRDNFSLSDNRLPAGVVAFGARDANDLIARLAVKRKTTQELAYEYARPLVDVMVKLGQPYASDVLVEKWSKIIGVLTDYEKKVPGNSLEDLERFVEEELNRVQLSTCAEQLKPHVNRYERDDFFKEAKYQIGSTMIRRCNEDLRKFTLQGYVEVYTLFTERLAGRFPFAGPDVIAEVETGDIVQFYTLFDKYAGAFKVFSRTNIVGGPIFGNSNADVLRFIQQVESMRPLFAPLLAAEDENPDLILDIDFEFRVNRDNEVNGNQIIDWYAQVADARIGHRDNKRGSQWRTNDPISVCFRWAKDAMFLPAVNQRNEAARINGRTACYAYQGRFPLFRMLVANAASPADRGRRSFLRPHTLRFETETSLASAAADNASLLVTATRVYVRVGLMLPGGKSAFRLPEFPRRAPEVSDEHLKSEGVRADSGGPEY